MLDYETRYVMIERYCLALVWATRRLRHYMTEYSVHLISRLDPLRYLFDRPALVGHLMRWLVLLTEFDIHYVTQKSIRGSIVADHLASLPVSDARAIDDDFPDEDVAAVTSLSGWRMYFDGAANHSGYGIGVLLISPHGDHIPRSVRLAFSDRHPATNNIVEYEACILGLETALELGIRQMEVFGDSNLVLRQIQGEWKTRDVKLRPYHAYLELLVARFEGLRYTHLPRAQNQFADALATLASMIDIPVDATVRPLLIESRSAPAYCCLIDDMEIDDGLPWRSPDGMLLLCLDRASADRVMREVHAGVCGPHMGGHMLARKIMRTGYFWLTMETDCCQFVQRCPECQIHGDLIHVPPSELHALTSPWPFSVWGIDIIGKISPKSSSGHEFILVAIDYFTKWVEAASYARLTSSGVASFIRSHIICRYGVPHELISDRGVHFRAEVDTLVQRYGIRHHRSSAYRPQTNGAVEAANKNIKRILRRMVETSRDWSEKLPFALWAYRTSFRTSTGATPYSLVYGMEAMLPVEIEMGSLRVALEQQIPEADWAQARFDQLNLLDERRLRAADHVRAYQRKMARAFKKRVKPRPLQIGDLVLKVIRGLIRDPRGKFRPNWSGPYFIRELTPEGAAWLMDLDGNRFSEPTNVDQLKRSITTFLHVFIVSPSFLSLLVIHLIPFASYSLLTATHLRSMAHGVHYTCCISYMRAWFLIIGYLGLVFLSFLLPYHLGLRYVPCLKTTLRPWDQMSSLIASTRTGLIQLCSDYQDQVHGSSRTCAPSLTGCSSRRGHDRLSYGASEIHTAGSALLDTWIPSCLSTWEGHISVRMRFTDHEGVACLALFGEISPLVYMIIHGYEIHAGSMFDLILSGYSEEPLLSHSARFIPFDIVGWGYVECLDPHVIISVRLVEPLLAIYSSLRFAAACHTGAYFPHIVSLQSSVQSRRSFTVYDIQSHHVTFFSSVFRATSQFDVQSHHHHFLVSVFRAIITTSLSFGVQSRHRFSDRQPSSTFRSTFRVTSSVSAFRAVIGFQIDVQSRVLVSAFRAITLLSVSAFRVVIGFQIDVQSRVLGFGVQSHYHFSASAFRAITTSQFRRSEPSSVFRSTFRVAFSVSAFRVVITSQLRCSEPSSLLLSVSAFRVVIGFQIDVQSRVLGFGVQSHYHFSASAFRAITTSQFRRSEPSSVFRSTFRVAFSVSAFRVVITSQLRCSEPSSLLLSVSAFRVVIGFQIDVQSRVLGFGVQSHYHFSASAFRAITTSQFRRSEPSSVFRSTFRVAFSVSAFRVVITSQLRCSEPSSLLLSVSAFRVVIGFQIDVQSRVLGFGVQSRYHFSASVFRAIITTSLSFGVQSRYHFSVSVFRAIITTSLSFGVQSHHRFSDRHSESPPRFRRLESLSLLSLTFRVIIIT
ncbi:Gypsy retrotransposon integrase-like protein 1, partial [Vitis vinifera]